MSNCCFLFLTEGCNLACRHCYVSASPAKHFHMSWETLDRAERLMVRFNIHDFRLTGGEPTTHPEFRGILDRLARAGHKLGLTTNGAHLLAASDAEAILCALDRCWVSAYGPTDALHARVGGGRAPKLGDLLAWIGGITQGDFPVGLSVLVTPGESHLVSGLVARAAEAGVRRLRLIPLQPDGRAQAISPPTWSNWPRELSALAELLRRHPCRHGFTELTLNDPFDTDARYGERSASCLLNGRRMWAIGSRGDVYPCCFTAMDARARLGSVWDEGIENVLLSNAVVLGGLPPCRALAPGYWTMPDPERVSCPIGKIDLLHDDTFPDASATGREEIGATD